MVSQDSSSTVLSRTRAAVRRHLRIRTKDVYRLDVALTHPETEAAPFRLEEGTPENLDRLHRERPDEVNERKHHILRARVDDPGEDVWVIVDDQGQQCGFACVAWTDHLIRKENHRVRVRPHQALLIDAYVLKGQRRRRAHLFAVLRRLEIAAERGRTEAIVAIDETNTASRASFAKLGATRIGRIVVLRRWKRSIELRRLSPERLVHARRGRERRGG